MNTRNTPPGAARRIDTRAPRIPRVPDRQRVPLVNGAPEAAHAATEVGGDDDSKSCLKGLVTKMARPRALYLRALGWAGFTACIVCGLGFLVR